MKITREQLASSNKQQLNECKQQLQVELMKLNKFFTIFLDSTDLREDEPNTTEWQVYREMTKEYEKINQLIRATDFYMGKYEERSTSV